MFFQRLIASVLLLTFFAQTFDQSFLELDFLMNRNYIAKTLCVNQDKPQMHCKGNCYLARQMQEQQDENKQSGNTRKEKFEVQFFFLPDETIINYDLPLIAVIYAPKRDNIIFQYQQSVFHPPCA
jgi:hypothetical protein